METLKKHPGIVLTVAAATALAMYPDQALARQPTFRGHGVVNMRESPRDRLDAECSMAAKSAAKGAAGEPNGGQGRVYYSNRANGTLDADVYKNPIKGPNHYFNGNTKKIEDVAYTVKLAGTMELDGAESRVDRYYAITGNGTAVMYGSSEGSVPGARTPSEKFFRELSNAIMGSTTPEAEYMYGILLPNGQKVIFHFSDAIPSDLLYANAKGVSRGDGTLKISYYSNAGAPEFGGAGTHADSAVEAHPNLRLSYGFMRGRPVMLLPMRR
ncbi:MAG: hypothetical protein ABSE71_04510 [Candidatus Micrarchaeaceae archaeon]|jgi:hypothetical protein